MENYRIKKYDVINDIWTLQERTCFIFWKTISAGSKAKLQAWIDEQNIIAYYYERENQVK